MHQKVVGVMPSQGKHLGCGFIPQLGCLQEATDRCFFLSPFPFLSVSKSIYHGVRI